MSDRPAGSERVLLDEHDALLVDLDGVVQLDEQPVDGAADALRDARRRGRRVVFLTNNAARTPADVVDRLHRLGIDASTDDVITSALAAARLLATRLESGTAVLVVGGPGLVDAVAAVGLRPVAEAGADPAAVVQGWGPDVGWRALAEATVAIRAGAAWIATNLDRTLPSPRGPLPGNGALIAAVRIAAGVEPEAVGKPGRPLFDAAVAQAGATQPLVVGDRLDTDIAGAVGADLPSLLVLTGVAGPADVLAAAPGQRPTYVGHDLRAVRDAHPPVRIGEGVATCRSATVTATGDVTTATPDDGDGLDGLRAACALAWSGLLPPERYGACLARLGLR